MSNRRIKSVSKNILVDKLIHIGGVSFWYNDISHIYEKRINYETYTVVNFKSGIAPLLLNGFHYQIVEEIETCYK